jgi:hypothetical protein
MLEEARHVQLGTKPKCVSQVTLKPGRRKSRVKPEARSSCFTCSGMILRSLTSSSSANATRRFHIAGSSSE